MVISPFISMETAKILGDIVKNNNIKCTVITRFDRALFNNGGSSIEALSLLNQAGADILALQNLHTKLYIIDNRTVFTGSANFTQNGLTKNIELLLLIQSPKDTLQFLNYARSLYMDILKSGNWYVDKAMIELELEVKKNLIPATPDPKLSFSWGASLSNSNTIDKDAIVLSVAIGGTYEIVEKFAIHSHPESYQYKSTKYITFRYPKGGHMKTVYEIIDTVTFNMTSWKVEIEKYNSSIDIYKRLYDYIVERQSGFKFEKDEHYKFYILETRFALPNNPRPKINNSGGWYYRLDDLIKATDYVKTSNK